MAARDELEQGIMRTHGESEKYGSSLKWQSYAGLLLNRKWLPERAPEAFAAAYGTVEREARAGDQVAARLIESASPETLALASQAAMRWGRPEENREKGPDGLTRCALVVIEARPGSGLREFADFSASLLRWYWSDVGRGTCLYGRAGLSLSRRSACGSVGVCQKVS